MPAPAGHRQDKRVLYRRLLGLRAARDNLAHPGGVLEPRLGERLQLAGLDSISSGTLRTEANCCALAVLDSSSRCERPASSALSACASPRPSSGEISAGGAAGVVGVVGAGVAVRGSAPLRVRGELGPVAGAAGAAARGALRHGFAAAAAGEGVRTDVASARALRAASLG